MKHQNTNGNVVCINCGIAIMYLLNIEIRLELGTLTGKRENMSMLSVGIE